MVNSHAGTSKLPLLKLMPLLLARVAEGATFTVIFPYINPMLLSFHVKEEELGYYAGITESSLMVAEAISAPLYAPLADRLGRRPVFLVLLFCWAIGGLAFGFCRSVASVVLMRGFLGLLAGCGVLSRTMIGEMCDRASLVQAFAIFSPALTVGMTIGPLIGGQLAEPVPRLLPSSFRLFTKFPYLLPSMVVSTLTVAATLSAHRYLTETLVRRQQSVKAKSGPEQLLRYQPFRRMLLLYSLNNGVMFSWEATYPLFLYTSWNLGGLGLQTIGIILGLAALLSIGMTSVIFPWLHRRMGQDQYLTLCLAAYPVSVLFFPLIWWISEREMGYMACLLMIIQLIVRRIGDFASTLLDTVVLDAIPGPEHLAMANSLTFSSASIARAIGPFIISWCFAISTRFKGIMGIMVWVVFFGLSIPSVLLSRNSSKDEVDPDETGDELLLDGRLENYS